MGAKRFQRLCTAESDEEKRDSLQLAVVCRARAPETGSRASLLRRAGFSLVAPVHGGTPRGCGTQRVASAFRVLAIGRCCWATESSGITPRCIGVITCYVEVNALVSFLELFNGGAV